MTAPPRSDVETITRAARLLVEPGGITELRALDAALSGDRRTGTASGYFNSPDALARAVESITSAKGIYIVPNPIDPRLLARASNRVRIVGRADPTTADHDILRRRWLPVDLDPVRPAGIGSSDAEHAAAGERAQAVRDFLRGDGWPEPIIADSGNGWHVLYRVDLPREDGGIVQRALGALAARFDDAAVKVDTGVHNPARIWKLYGTRACKGDDSPDRPHRMARLVDVPEPLDVVPDWMLHALAGPAPTGPTRPAAVGASPNGSPRGGFDLPAWIARHLPEATGPKAWNGGELWMLPVCPFNSEHTGGSAFVGHLASGAITAGCHHNSCQHWGWRELRELLDPRPPSPGPASNPARAEPAAGDSDQRPDPGAINGADLIREFPELRPVTIDGLLREGETMNVIAAPKVGKSWLAHSMALSVLTGREWFGKPTRAGSVLLIDGELHHETLAHRLSRTARQLAITPEQLAQLTVWPLRGKRWTIDDIAAALAAHPPGTFRLVVVDALYRFLPTDGEENSNETMTRIYNTLDAMADGARASVVVIHHATKGDQSGKSVTDVGAGGGAQSRAADTHLVLRQHEEPDAVVVQAVVRSFAPPDPFVLRRCNPGWELAPDLDPSLLYKPPRRNASKAAAEPAAAPPRQWTPEDFARECVGAVSIIREEVIAKATAAGLSKSAAGALLKRAESAGVVFRVKGSGIEPHRFTTEAQQPLPRTPDGAGDRGEPGEPPPPERSAPGGVGGPRYPPPPPPPADTAAAKPPKATKARKPSDKRPGPPDPCYGCKHTRWWSIRGRESDGWTCGACHPPVEDGPDVVWWKNPE